MPPSRNSVYRRYPDHDVKGPPSGSFVYSYGGGPIWSDNFKFRRGPTPPELIESYKSLIYTCTNLNARGVAATTLRLFATTKGGQHRPKCATKSIGRATKARLKSLEYARKSTAPADDLDEVTEHPLLDAVMKVNDDLDHTQLIMYTVMSLDIVGSAYWWPNFGAIAGRKGLPEEIWALPPHLVYPVFTSGTMVPDEYTFGGIMYPKGDLVRFRHLSAKNPYGQGYGPTQAAIEYARLEDTFVSIQDNMLSNGPRPSLLVSLKDDKAGGSFGEAERRRLEHRMDQQGRGGRSGGVFTVDAAVAVTPLSYSPTDLGGLEISSYDMERIANCFDVPVSMLKTEDVNRANADAGLEQHARNAVEPRCKAIASTLTRWTHSLDPRGKLGYDRLFWAFDSAVMADKRDESDLHKTYIDLGVIARNEVRLDLGYDAIEGGDEILVNGSLKTLQGVIDASDQPPQPAPGQGVGMPADGEGLPAEDEDISPMGENGEGEDETPEDEAPQEAEVPAEEPEPVEPSKAKPEADAEEPDPSDAEEEDLDDDEEEDDGFYERPKAKSAEDLARKTLRALAERFSGGGRQS